MIPPEALKAPKLNTFSGQTSHPPELYTHLSRTNGKISYAIAKKLSTKEKVFPTIWVSQDKFLLSKIRIQPSVTINLSKYKKIEKKMWQPMSQVIKFNNYTIKVNTISVAPISKALVQKEFNVTNSLRSEAKLNFNNSALESFYSKFR